MATIYRRLRISTLAALLFAGGWGPGLSNVPAVAQDSRVAAAKLPRVIESEGPRPRTG